MGYALAAVGMGLFGGVAAGTFLVIGAIETATGRMVINIHRLPWEPDEVRIIGCMRIAAAAVILLDTGVIAMLIATDLSVRLLGPVALELNFVLMAVAMIHAGLEMRLRRRIGRPLL